jgi:cytochrome c-type biogenesis protein CcmH/NrfG
VNLDANDVRSLYLLGAALANDGHPADAERVLERAVELAPDNATFAEALESVRRELPPDAAANPDGRP